jgi:hypothetical protein
MMAVLIRHMVLYEDWLRWLRAMYCETTRWMRGLYMLLAKRETSHQLMSYDKYLYHEGRARLIGRTRFSDFRSLPVRSGAYVRAYVLRGHDYAL